VVKRWLWLGNKVSTRLHRNRSQWSEIIAPNFSKFSQIGTESDHCAGVCGSGQNADCRDDYGRKYYHRLQCTKFFGENSWKNGSPTAMEVAKYGVTKHCPSGLSYCSRCGSGKNADCFGGYHTMQCCESNNFKISDSEADCYTQPGNYGHDIPCQPDNALVSTCGSGKNADCGRHVWVMAKCCRLYPIIPPTPTPTFHDEV